MSIKLIVQKLEKCTSYNQKRIFLQSLGRVNKGSTRMCVKLGTKYVLKVARNCYGNIQNEREVTTWMSCKKSHRKYFATIYRYDHIDYEWIIQELITFPRLWEQRKKLLNFLPSHLIHIIQAYDLDFSELAYQVGRNNKGKVKIYDYGYSYYD